MATTVSMPQLGETVTEGTILKWAKKVGDTIAEDEVLVEISTDKVDTEVPSPVSGTILDILVEEGATVGVGTDLVVIGDADEKPAPAPEETPEVEAEEQPSAEELKKEEPKEELHPASETPSGPDTGFEAGGPVSSPRSEATVSPPSEALGGVLAEPGRGVGEMPPKAAEGVTDEEIEAFFAEPSPETKTPNLLSPVVRRLVREHDIDISQIQGTGQGGRITRKDVEAHISSPRSGATLGEVPPKAAEGVPAPAPEAAPEPAPAAAKAPEPSPAVAGEEVELDRLRVRIAENMSKAKQTAAHVWTSVEVDFERLERVRQSHKDQFKKEEGFSLTYLPFISRATIDALKAFPVVNSSFNLEERTATYHKKVDLGIAIDLDQGGLVVARIRNADGLRLVGLAREIRVLAETGRQGKLGIDDLTGSTFTITNPGPFGSYMSMPIINVPNVAILSTDTITKRPTVITTSDGQDMIAIRHIGYLGLTWDHRAFDGSTAVMFLRRIKENIETWDWEQELA